jgi:hypothetical protein
MLHFFNAGNNPPLARRHRRRSFVQGQRDVRLPKSEKKKKAGGGQRNPLKTLVSAMEIQDNQSVFLGKIWPKPCLAWLDFEKFGDLFDNVKTPSASTAAQATPKGARRKCALPGGGASTQFPNPR